MTIIQSGRPAGQRQPEEPLFPPARAFLVRLRRDCDAARGRYAGCLEHIVTGRSRPFESLDELLALIAQLLLLQARLE